MISPEQRAWANGYADLYVALYERINGVVDNPAASVSACNGAMIAADRAGMVVPREGADPPRIKIPGPPIDEAARPEPLPAPYQSASREQPNGVGKCPKCGNTDINRTSRVSGKPYQACTKCGVFISSNGTTRPMGGR